MPQLVRETGIPRDTLHGSRRQALAQGATPAPATPMETRGSEAALPLRCGPVIETPDIPFGTTDRFAVERTGQAGERGTAWWRRCSLGSIRARVVEYPPGHLADHRSGKGQVLLCPVGELHTELADARRFGLTPGAS